MESKTAAEIAEALAPCIAAAGLVPISVEAKPGGEPPFDAFAVVDVLVGLEGTSAEEVYRKTRALERSINRAFGCGSRTGYYGAEDGCDDVPAGQALVQIDLLPFTLAADPSPSA